MLLIPSLARQELIQATVTAAASDGQEAARIAYEDGEPGDARRQHGREEPHVPLWKTQVGFATCVRQDKEQHRAKSHSTLEEGMQAYISGFQAIEHRFVNYFAKTYLYSSDVIPVMTKLDYLLGNVRKY